MEIQRTFNIEGPPVNRTFSVEGEPRQRVNLADISEEDLDRMGSDWAERAKKARAALIAGNVSRARRMTARQISDASS